MEDQITLLFRHEKETLLDALRRDMRNELDKAENSPELAIYHHSNARYIKRLLEILNPKSMRCEASPQLGSEGYVPGHAPLVLKVGS